MNTRLIAAAEAVMVAAAMLAAGCGSAAASAPMPTPSPTHSFMSLAASSTSPSPSHSAPPPTAPTLSATTFPVAALLASCYPTASSGNCYQPGQICPSSYHGASGGYGSTARPPAPARSPPRPLPPAAAARPGSRTPCCSGSAWRRCWPAPGAWPTAGGSPGNADQGSGRRTLPGADLRGLPGPPARPPAGSRRQRVSGRWPRAVSTVWTTGCYPGRTCTPCSMPGVHIRRPLSWVWRLGTARRYPARQPSDPLDIRTSGATRPGTTVRQFI